MVALAGQWTRSELDVARKALEQIPAKWLSAIEGIERQPKLVNAPPSAPGHSKYDPQRRVIVVYDKGVYDGGKISSEQFRRSIYHELAHAILQRDPAILDRWTAQTSQDGFVDEYAKTSPTEDFCDTFSEFFIFPKRSKQAVPRKWRFLDDLMHQEKTAMYKLAGFNDELYKMAKSPGAMAGLKNMMGRILGSRIAKGGIVLGGGALGGSALGLASGRKKGYEMGTKDVEDVALQALQVGRQQGAQMGYQYAMQEMGKQAAPNVGTGTARQRAMGNVSMTLPNEVNMPAENVTARRRKPTKQDQIAAGLRRMTGMQSGGGPGGGYDVTANRANVGRGAPVGRGVSMRLPDRSKSGFAVNMPTERIVAGGGKRKPRGGSPVASVTKEVRRTPAGSPSGGFAMGKMNLGEGYDPLAKGRKAGVPQRQVPRAVAEFRGKTPSEAAPSVAYDVRRGQTVAAGPGGRPKIDLNQSMNELLSRR